MCADSREAHSFLENKKLLKDTSGAFYKNNLKIGWGTTNWGVKK